MLRIDPGYWYRLSESIHPLTNLPKEETPLKDIYLTLRWARTALAGLLNTVTTSRGSVVNLINMLDSHLGKENETIDFDKPIYPWDLYGISDAANKFETTLKAEIGISPSYIVTPKGGYNVDVLTLNPRTLFPDDLLTLLPESQHDIEQIGKCLAFEVPTAAAFHLHRLNEAVLRLYWDCYTDGAKRPKQQSMGVYLEQLNKREKKEVKLIAVLTQIKDLHRNPSLHPDESLTIEEAIELYGIIRSSIGRMLTSVRKLNEAKSTNLVSIAAE